MTSIFISALAMSAETYDNIYTISMMALIPLIIVTLIVGARVKTVFNRYSADATDNRYTGEDAARAILNDAGLTSTPVRGCSGSLTDHYDPRNDTVYLSESVKHNGSVAAVGVAAHEVGHAIQHSENYFAVKIRTLLVPICNFTSRYSFPLIIIGSVISMMGLFLGDVIYFIGVLFYAVYTLFTLVTLPVEFNASRRALAHLEGLNILTDEEMPGARKVLRAAAATYLMSFAMSLLYLLRYASLLGRRRR